MQRRELCMWAAAVLCATLCAAATTAAGGAAAAGAGGVEGQQQAQSVGHAPGATGSRDAAVGASPGLNLPDAKVCGEGQTPEKDSCTSPPSSDSKVSSGQDAGAQLSGSHARSDSDLQRPTGMEQPHAQSDQECDQTEGELEESRPVGQKKVCKKASKGHIVKTLEEKKNLSDDLEAKNSPFEQVKSVVNGKGREAPRGDLAPDHSAEPGVRDIGLQRPILPLASGSQPSHNSAANSALHSDLPSGGNSAVTSRDGYAPAPLPAAAAAGAAQGPQGVGADHQAESTASEGMASGDGVTSTKEDTKKEEPDSIGSAPLTSATTETPAAAADKRTETDGATPNAAINAAKTDATTATMAAAALLVAALASISVL
ncbi:hypothetical protein DQ04_08821010 [Trypanosoma grayi]|uniref:hypothetical protein n=1 Tax=Trypanosoma grayi TaxID=71804 RepID=UPI0004F47A6A|nr:hypothetical protein DQ04_08821010 [Trypanosoma grayi]KEG07790.1 hypothetical protein DQ04_08821010 [Trypanosoma grayi]